MADGRRRGHPTLDVDAGHRRLAAAVIHQAFRDFEKGPMGKDKNRSWRGWYTALNFLQSDMYPYAEFIGFEPCIIHEKLPSLYAIGEGADEETGNE